MTNKFSRLTALMACSLAVLFFTSFQVQAFVGEKFIVNDLKYMVLTENTSTGTVLVYESYYPTGEVVIPASIENNNITYSVTAIGEEAFYEYKGLIHISIPETVTSIGTYAFYHCTSLESIIIPDSVISIGIGAFEGCRNLSNVVIGNGVANIADYTFSNCNNLSNVAVGNSVTNIGECAFSECEKLKSITFPSSLVFIGDNAFYNCRRLAKLYFKGNAPKIGSNICNRGVIIGYIKETEGWSNPWNGFYTMWYKNPDLPVKIIYDSYGDGTAAVVSYEGSPESITIPETVLIDSVEHTVISVEHNAFAKCKSLIEIELPPTLQIIGEDAFFGCLNLQKISIPESVTRIESGAFANCKSLVQIDIPPFVKEMGASVFYKCEKLKFAYIPDSCVEAGAYMFKNCNALETVIIGAGIKDIQDGFFLGCGKVKDDYYQKPLSDRFFFNCGNLQEVYFLGDNPGITYEVFLIDSYSVSLGTNTIYSSRGSQQSVPRWWVDPIQGKTPTLYYLNDRIGWNSLSYENALNKIGKSSWENLSYTLNCCHNKLSTFPDLKNHFFYNS